MVQAIDVSDNQGVIDWLRVKQAGIQAAILRSVRGSGKADYQFENNFAGCNSNGIAVGVYKYSYATTIADAVNEAKQVVALLDGRKLQCRVWFDMEDKCQRILSKQALTAIAKEFYYVIAKAGYQFGIYTNLDWYNNVLDVAELNRFCEAWWIARYGTDTGQAQQQYKPDIRNMKGWQYTSKGSVPGINGYVDRDEYYEGIPVSGSVPEKQNSSGTKYAVGQKVRVSSYYASSTETNPDKAVRRNAAGTITRVIPGAHNPYLLDNGEIGWCNDGDVREVINASLYYEKYTGKSSSIVDALNELKIDGSFSNRAKIAEKNHINNYRGSAAQNEQMLRLLKYGKLLKG